jgi:hypothetical protein
VGRAKKNRIKHLRKDDGQITKERNEMENMTLGNFSASVQGRS